MNELNIEFHEDVREYTLKNDHLTDSQVTSIQTELVKMFTLINSVQSFCADRAVSIREEKIGSAVQAAAERQDWEAVKELSYKEVEISRDELLSAVEAHFYRASLTSRKRWKEAEPDEKIFRMRDFATDIKECYRTTVGAAGAYPPSVFWNADYYDVDLRLVQDFVDWYQHSLELGVDTYLKNKRVVGFEVIPLVEGVGTLLKDPTPYHRRLKSALYKQLHFKLPNCVYSEFGNLLFGLLGKAETYKVSFLPPNKWMDKSAKFMCNEGSCWFGNGSHRKSRIISKHHNVQAMLIWGSNKTQPIGRCFVYPCVQGDNKGLVVFNSYGFSRRVFAQLIGDKTPIREIRFSIDNAYINGGAADFVGHYSNTSDHLHLSDDNTYIRCTLCDQYDLSSRVHGKDKQHYFHGVRLGDEKKCFSKNIIPATLPDVDGQPFVILSTENYRSLLDRSGWVVNGQEVSEITDQNTDFVYEEDAE